MKRVISWVILAAAAYGAIWVCGIVSGVVLSLAAKVLSSGTAIILLILFGGGGTLAVVSVAFVLLASVVMSLSETVCASKNGVRYRVAGIIIMVLYALFVIGILAGVIQTMARTAGIVSGIIYFYFGLMLLFVSFSEKRIMWASRS